MPLGLQSKVVKFIVGTAVDISAYETWLVNNPTAVVDSTVVVDSGNDGPTLIVTYRL